MPILKFLSISQYYAIDVLIAEPERSTELVSVQRSDGGIAYY